MGFVLASVSDRFSLRHEHTKCWCVCVCVWGKRAPFYLLNTSRVHDGFEIISYIVKQLVEVNALPNYEIHYVLDRRVSGFCTIHE